ncbi:MAG: hypothetical protein WBN70_02300 [Polyangiales bacterium]
MRLAAFASLLIAGFAWFALSGAPAEVSADEKAPTCQACGQSSANCPHCAAGKDCPHCKSGEACPHCKGDKACPHCAQGKSCSHCGHHGKWGPHKWDYKCVRPPKKPEEVTAQFNALGDDGWRLLQADGGIWCFSRMKPQ